mgnify:CR=1 FL=1
MSLVVEDCRYEMPTRDGESDEIEKRVDFTKFRRGVTRLNMNEGIKVNIKEARLKREQASIQKELDVHLSKSRKKQTKQKKIGGLTVEELHEKMRNEKREQLDAKRRHLKRAFAGIDKSKI